MNRRYLALAALGLAVVLAGCLGGGGPSKSQLNENATYDWNTSANVTVRLGSNAYTAVYDLHNESDLALYSRNAFSNRSPLSIRGLQFRYPNGTVVGASAFEVSSNDERTKVVPPARTGKLAFSVAQSGKQYRSPKFLDGSHEVVLPPDTGVGIPILSDVVPGGYETRTVDGRVHITWEKVSGDTIVVEYYLSRDLLLFGGLFGLLFVVGAGGLLYYWRQIRSLEAKRDEVGLDVDEEDDPRDQGPPPGMR